MPDEHEIEAVIRRATAVLNALAPGGCEWCAIYDLLAVAANAQALAGAVEDVMTKLPHDIGGFVSAHDVDELQRCIDRLVDNVREDA